MRFLHFLLIFLAAPAAAATAADVERSVTLRERWMYLTENVADQANWAEDGRGFVYRKTVPGGFRFVTYDLATKTKTPSFDHDAIAAALGKATGTPYEGLRLPFESFRFADAGAAILVSAADAQWRCTLAAPVCAKAPRTNQPRGFGVVRDREIPADNSPRVSPDGKWEARIDNFNVAVRPAGSQEWRRLGTDGSEGDFYDPESIVWSPDSQKLAAYRVRPGFRRIVHRVASAPDDQVEPKLLAQLYPKPGDPVDIDRPVLFHVGDGRQLAVADDLFPNPYVMSKLAWRKDSASVSFTYQERGHQRARVIAIDAETGVPRVAISEETKTFINMGRRFLHELDNGRELIWMSERDGWNHLYLFDGRNGGVKRQLTRGQWLVREVLKVDEDKRQIYFTASGRDPGRDPYFQHVYRIDLDGRNLTRLSSVDAYHDVAFSPDAAHYVLTYSRVDLPPVMELRRTSDGGLIETIETADISKLLAAGFRHPEPFVAKGRDGKTDIYGLIVRPRDFDPNKRYPVIENIYAGPHDNFVPKTWWPFGYHSGGDKVVGMQAQADLGFVVVQIDGMGTLNRSKAFHDVAWKNLADGGFPDRILWHRAVAAQSPWYDVGRVGIYGGSAGGQSTVHGLLFHPDFYKVGVAYVGCYDNRMDKISWNEQWLGWPVDESYTAASGVVHAHKLQGELFMILGELDMNVDPASTYQMADALVKAGKDFDLLTVPGGGHSVGRASGPIDYVQRRQFDFFLRHLAGAETPSRNAP